MTLSAVPRVINAISWLTQTMANELSKKVIMPIAEKRAVDERLRELASAVQLIITEHAALRARLDEARLVPGQLETAIRTHTC